MSVDLATLALKVEALEVDAASKKLDNLTAAGGRTEKAAGGMSTAFRALGAALATVQLANMIKESALMAARYETMGAAMVTVGNNAGYTGSQMAEYEKRLRSTGIAMIESRETLTKMAASHIDLAKATDLARIAQDAAVVGNINSSEAFDRMINGIRSAEVEVLRGIGLNVNFEQSYAKLAAQLGKNAKDLTETEKGQARVNSVLAAGTGIAGTYEAAMGTAGKMLNSMQRYADDLKVSLGAAFGPAVTLLVDQMTGALKDANSEVRDGQSTIDAWGVKFRSAIISIEAELIRLSMLIDKVGGTMTAVLTGAGELIDVAMNIKGAVSDMYTGVDTGWAESELTKLGKQWNKVYEDRYKAGDKALQDLADLESKLTNEVKGGTSAQEQARIAAGKNGRTLVQNEETRAAALKKAEEEAKKSRTASEAAAKASAQEYQSILDSLEPVRVEQEEYNKALAVLNKMDPTHETERYKAGLEQLNSTLSANIELEEYRKNIIGQRADYEKQVAQASMTDAEIRIDNINRELLALEEYGQRLVGLGEAEQSVVDANNEAFGEKARKQIEDITDNAGEMGRMFEDVAKNIQSAFAGMFEDMLDGSENTLDSLGDMFKKLLAQMATMAIANPIIVPIVMTIGTGMGLSTSNIASTLGMDTSQISAASGMGGISSLFSSGSLQGMGVSSLATIGGFAQNIGMTAVGNIAMEAGTWLNGLSSGLADGLMGGLGSLATSLLSGQGINEKTGMQAVGSALGAMSGLGVVGSVLGGLVGSLVGDMFGTGVDTFGPQYMANDVGVNYNATTGMTPTTIQYTGGDTDSQIAKVYAEQMRSIQAAFDEQVTALAEALPDEISSAMLESLASADLKQILNDVSGQEINVADAASWMEGVAEDYSEALMAELGKAYGTALSSFISTNGAEGLVGDSEAWGMLTDAVKQNITDSFQSAADTIAGGDIDTGMETINSVTNAIAAIESAMAPISEIVATDGLTEYEKSIRSINIQFDNYRDALKAAGVDMAKYTDLETARGIAIAAVNKEYNDNFMEKFAPSDINRGNTIAEFNEQVTELGIIVPSTRDAFYSLIMGMETTTESGLATKNALIGMADAADEMYSSVEVTAAEAASFNIRIMELTGDASGALTSTRRIELATLDDSLKPLQERIWALEDEAEVASFNIRIMELEGKATEALAAQRQIELNALTDNLKPLQEYIWALEDEAEARAAIKSVMDGVYKTIETAGMTDYEKSMYDINERYAEWAKVLDENNASPEENASLVRAKVIEIGQLDLGIAEGALRDAFDAEQDRLSKEHETTIDRINEQLNIANESVSSLDSLSSSLRSTMSNLLNTASGLEETTRKAAQSDLSNMVESARLGIFPLTNEEYSDTLSTLSKDSTGLFASFEEYQRDYWKTYLKLAEMSQLTDDQLSVEEKIVKGLSAQLDAEDAWYEEQAGLLTAQLDAILGVSQTIVSLEAAIAGYYSAASVAGSPTPSNSGSYAVGGNYPSYAPTAAEVDQAIYDKYPVGEDGRPHMSEEEAARTYDLAYNLVTDFAARQEKKRLEMLLLNMPSFATGTDSVPYDMVAKIHEGERITPKAYNRSDSTNEEIVSGLSALRESNNRMLAELVEIKRTNKRISDITEKSDIIGPAPARAEA